MATAATMTTRDDLEASHDDPGHSQDNSRLGALIFLMAGVMFFAGLVGGFVVLRFSGITWPAPGMPHLPVRLAGFNTVVILLSSLAMRRAVRAMRTLDAVGLRRGLVLAAALGVAFLSLQALQWRRLLALGLGPAATTYGSTFYLLTGAHALHATSGVIWLLAIAIRQRELWVPETRRRGIEVCALYWHFVGLVWVGLYFALYLL
ncbi:MAG TPA: heme-copper oxidase subunit III [Candidatus Polarisedimenticolia bacterium]|nr:heme-copper oxidase subunit III [Candidatus Polarisedimenticolia bacterium]